jgi:hypothetical protein
MILRISIYAYETNFTHCYRGGIFFSLYFRTNYHAESLRPAFGVDADLRANYFNGFVQSGNDDWYNNGTAGTGFFVIDTTGAASIVAGYLSDVSPGQKEWLPYSVL